MDAVKYLLNEEAKEAEEAAKANFSFDFMAHEAIKRQKIRKDTIVLIIGDRGSGKSNYALKLIKAFIKRKRMEDPGYKWNWKKNFPLTRSQAMKMVSEVEFGSFIDYDEGGDIAYSSDTLAAMNKRLVKFMLKSRIKGLLTIICLPDIFTLDKKILNMAHFMIAVPYRYEMACSFAFIYGRTSNPFIQDKFGLENVKRYFASKKVPRAYRIPTLDGKHYVMKRGKKTEIPYPKELFTFFRSLPNFLHFHSFNAVDKNFERRYEENVKSKQLNAQEEEGALVSITKLNKLYEKYKTVLYNLYYKGDYNYSQIERLHLNKFGVRLAQSTTIKKEIESLAAEYEGGNDGGRSGGD